MKKSVDPVRLAEAADTPAPLVEALRAARGGPEPGSVERLSAALGVAAPVAPPIVPPASGLAVASGTTLPMLGVVALIGAAGIGSVVIGLAPLPSASPTPAHAVSANKAVEPPAPAATSPAEPQVSETPPSSAPIQPARRRRAEPEPVAEPTSAAKAVEVAPAAPPADAASRLREEALLVRNAERLLGSDPARALGLTEERRRRFPGGALDQEAEVVAIDALLRLGRRESAAQRARTFESRHPGSVHARRIRALIGSDP